LLWHILRSELIQEEWMEGHNWEWVLSRAYNQLWNKIQTEWIDVPLAIVMRKSCTMLTVKLFAEALFQTRPLETILSWFSWDVYMFQQWGLTQRSTPKSLVTTIVPAFHRANGKLFCMQFKELELLLSTPYCLIPHASGWIWTDNWLYVYVHHVHMIKNQLRLSHFVWKSTDRFENDACKYVCQKYILVNNIINIELFDKK